MMPYIHLKHYHTTVQGFYHPLLEGAEVHTTEELDDMAQKVLDGADPEPLILGLRRTVSLLVGRYLANWPATTNFLDEMVSEGILAITALCDDIPLDTFAGCGIMTVATYRAQAAIEEMLNEMQSLSAPGTYKQKELMRAGDSPEYIHAEFDCVECKIFDNDYTRLQEMYDSIASIQPEDDLDAALMDPINWERTADELESLLGVDDNTIYRRRERLYEKYLELME